MSIDLSSFNYTIKDVLVALKDNPNQFKYVYFNNNKTVSKSPLTFEHPDGFHTELNIFDDGEQITLHLNDGVLNIIKENGIFKEISKSNEMKLNKARFIFQNKVKKQTTVKKQTKQFKMKYKSEEFTIK